ncbi:hypothetical protein KHC23_13320 [Ancylobacter dichloromethanicus]|nr:hypothetical protein [Ancylobacter dichloromethanicus]MBS7554631.1 hypothetical protein [Ancylobacter dichloromethanicus]
MTIRSRMFPQVRRLAPAAFGGGLLVALTMGAAVPADAAVIYCTSPGFPVGCVVRATPYAAPAARAAVHCTRPGYPVGCTAGANANARAVARPGPGVNVNGGVNRAGLR